MSGALCNAAWLASVSVLASRLHYKTWTFFVLNLALHREIILQNPSFCQGNKTEMVVEYGIFSLTCMCCFRCIDMHVHMNESALKSLSTITSCFSIGTNRKTLLSVVLHKRSRPSCG